jgi:hypothetical protein
LRLDAIAIIELLLDVIGFSLLVIIEPPSFIKIMIFISATDGFKKYLTKGI